MSFKSRLRFKLINSDRNFDILLTEFNKLHNAYQTMKVSENVSILDNKRCMEFRREIERIVSLIINDTNNLAEKGIRGCNYGLRYQAHKRFKLIEKNNFAKYIGENDLWKS